MADEYAQMELACAQAKYLLEQDLPSELDRLIAARNDGIDLPHPARVTTAVENWEDLPVVAVLADTSKPQIDMGHSLIADHFLHIEVVLTNSDAEELDVQIKRYMVAIKRVLLRTRRLEVNGSQTAFSISWTDDDYGFGGKFKDKPELTVNTGAIRFKLSSDEQ